MDSVSPLREVRDLSSTSPDVVYREARRLMSDHRMYLPGRVRTMRASIRAARLERSALLSFEYGLATEICSAPLEGYSTVHVPVAGRLLVEHEGAWHPVGTDAAAVFSHGSPVRMRWSSDLRLVVARIDQEALLDRLGGMVRLGRDPLVFSPFLARSGAGGSVSGAVLAMTGALEGCGAGGLNPALVGRLEELLISGLLLGHHHSYSAALSAPVAAPSPRLVARAVEHLEADLAAPISSAQLAAAVGVSERTLYDAFRRAVGTSPQRHLRELRLDRARQALVDGSCDSVAQAAHAVGLHHLGRFAALYRQRFGESPHETLRGSPRW
ncbi:AraC family transcriptional regulator [Herbiconiux sp. KACC 21604]|uniref:AraC family transcriptional regulator n=1 Tax=unclassified Herbiconiux TaxID=2618217 RepID=UPI0014919CDD|nr:AraC family transcriptional regulator [Herbiconiux sp. SALV-R1]QJU53909.1 AraC family transcriptional regulator [Herbiconiux sp. SALV-R1]WPO84928.1 AraC family transcriptional regulator [Herbiconiux sp. KACC 21604]